MPSQKRARVHAPPLEKGMACISCKLRKVKCDAQLPHCSSCVRTAGFEGRPLELIECCYTQTPRKSRKKRKASTPIKEDASTPAIAEDLVAENMSPYEKTSPKQKECEGSLLSLELPMDLPTLPLLPLLPSLPLHGISPLPATVEDKFSSSTRVKPSIAADLLAPAPMSGAYLPFDVPSRDVARQSMVQDDWTTSLGVTSALLAQKDFTWSLPTESDLILQPQECPESLLGSPDSFAWSELSSSVSDAESDFWSSTPPLSAKSLISNSDDKSELVSSSVEIANQYQWFPLLTPSLEVQQSNWIW